MTAPAPDTADYHYHHHRKGTVGFVYCHMRHAANPDPCPGEWANGLVLCDGRHCEIAEQA